jgi:hypothetical protein
MKSKIKENSWSIDRWNFDTSLPVELTNEEKELIKQECPDKDWDGRIEAYKSADNFKWDEDQTTKVIRIFCPPMYTAWLLRNEK